MLLGPVKYTKDFEAQPLLMEIASDSYWDGEVQEPFSEKDRLVNKDHIAIYSDLETGQLIGNLVLSLARGGKLGKIPEGRTPKFPSEPARKVVKLVEDCRETLPTVALRFAPRQNHHRKYQKIQDLWGHTLDSFDTLARAMAEPSAYDFIEARAYIPLDSKRIAAVSRRVTYVRASDIPRVGTGVYSGSIHREEPSTRPIPAVAVGSIYKRTRRDNELVKVVSASVLEPDTIVWRTPSGNQKHKEQEKQRKPLLAPRLSPSF